MLNVLSDAHEHVTKVTVTLCADYRVSYGPLRTRHDTHDSRPDVRGHKCSTNIMPDWYSTVWNFIKIIYVWCRAISWGPSFPLITPQCPSSGFSVQTDMLACWFRFIFICNNMYAAHILYYYYCCCCSLLLLLLLLIILFIMNVNSRDILSFNATISDGAKLENKWREYW